MLIGRRSALIRAASTIAYGLGVDGCSEEQERTRALRADLTPSSEDPNLSAGFMRLSRQAPWLSQIRSSVGKVVCFASHGLFPLGSCVLLDAFGTLILTAHQARYLQQLKKDGYNVDYQIVAFPTSPGRIAVTLSHFTHLDDNRDVAFAQTNPERYVDTNSVVDLFTNPSERQYQTSESFGVHPVAVFPAFDELNEEKECYVVGYPGQGEFTSLPVSRRPLNASVGTPIGVAGIVNRIAANNAGQGRYCRASSSAYSLGGNSGGGVFMDGMYLGPLTDGNVGIKDDHNHEYIEPFESWFTFGQFWIPYYKSIYPERFAGLKVNAPSQPLIPGCAQDDNGLRERRTTG